MAVGLFRNAGFRFVATLALRATSGSWRKATTRSGYLWTVADRSPATAIVGCGPER
jgi:hypothetical protein